MSLELALKFVVQRGMTPELQDPEFIKYLKWQATRLDGYIQRKTDLRNEHEYRSLSLWRSVGNWPNIKRYRENKRAQKEARRQKQELKVQADHQEALLIDACLRAVALYRPSEQNLTWELQKLSLRLTLLGHNVKELAEKWKMKVDLFHQRKRRALLAIRPLITEEAFQYALRGG